jgi:hypothetical protein
MRDSIANIRKEIQVLRVEVHAVRRELAQLRKSLRPKPLFNPPPSTPRIPEPETPAPMAKGSNLFPKGYDPKFGQSYWPSTRERRGHTGSSY